MNNMKKLHPDVQELFNNFTANQIIELFEMLDLFIVNEGMKTQLINQFGVRYDYTFYLLKRLIRAIEPTKPMNPSEN